MARLSHRLVNPAGVWYLVALIRTARIGGPSVSTDPLLRFTPDISWSRRLNAPLLLDERRGALKKGEERRKRKRIVP